MSIRAVLVTSRVATNGFAKSAVPEATAKAREAGLESQFPLRTGIRLMDCALAAQQMRVARIAAEKFGMSDQG